MPGALDGLIVVDFSRILAGPYATMHLGDLGARVIKIEQPGRGDDTRGWGPPFTTSGESAYFLCANRNKESITLDLKHPTGCEIARQLIARADILVENFKVGGMQTLGLDYTTASAVNPRLIYCSITGYGQTGPYVHRAGYDAVIEAEGGIMSITGPEDQVGIAGQPYKLGVAIVDITAGLQAVSAILAALHHRHRTGEGQYIDIALLDTQIGWLANVASSYLVSGEPPRRFGNAHGTIVPYQAVRAADGWLMLAVGNDLQFARLARLLGRAEWASDDRFRTNEARVRHRDALIPQVEAEILRKRVAEWVSLLMEAGIPAGPVNDIPTALNDPQVTARAMIRQVEHPVDGTIPLIGPVPKLSKTPAEIYLPPPHLGEHTRLVLHELLGYTEQTIDSLAETGAI